MIEEQLKHAAHELAATCESLAAESEDNEDAIFEYLTRLGLNLLAFEATPGEMWQVERFWGEFREAWKQREAKGDVTESMRDAFDAVNKELWRASETWHDTCPRVDEFWLDYTTCLELEELNELLDHHDKLFMSGMHELLKEYEPEAENEYHALEQRRDYERAAKEVMRETREEARAIRAKARVVKNECDMVGMIVKDGRVFDVHRVPAL